VLRINVKSAGSKITTGINGDKVKVYVALKGKGAIYANTTRLDLTIPQNIKLAEEAIETRIKDQVQTTIQLVQKNYKSDIFGFGAAIYQHQPQEWKQLKDHWDDIFSTAEVYVSVDFKIRMTGMSGQPLYLKEEEVKEK
jgi:spore germination protein KC